MRSSQKSNRSRGKSNRKNVGNNVNRVYESAGPDGKVRGTPQQIIDKYSALARDAQTSGDRVAAENFLQHAEHYQRLLSAAMAAQSERREQTNAAQQQPQSSEGEAAPSDSAPEATSASENSEGVNGMATFDGGEKTQLVETPEGGQGRRSPRRRAPRQSANGAGGSNAAEVSAEAQVDAPAADETSAPAAEAQTDSA